MTPTEQLVGNAVASWKTIIGRLNETVAAADNDKLQREVAPGRNRVFYLVAHLTAVHDRLLPLLRIGDRLHPELDAPYLENPDRTLPDSISAETLNKAWTEVNDKLTPAIEKFTPEEWLERHASVSPEDFAQRSVAKSLRGSLEPN